MLRFEFRMEQPPQPEGLPVTGGGALLDLGSHAVDQALHLFGPVRSVYAELRTAPGEVGFDERFFVALRHQGGVISHVTGNWARQGDVGSRFRVDGAAATLVVPDDDGQTERLMAGRTPRSERSEWGTVPESRWGAVHRGGVAVRVLSELGVWSAFYTGSARAVRGDGPPPSTPGTQSPASRCSMPHGRARRQGRWSSPLSPAGRDNGVGHRSGHPPGRPTPLQRDHPPVAQPLRPCGHSRSVGSPGAGFAATRTPAGNRPWVGQ